MSYPTNDDAAALAVAHHVSGTFANPAARQLSRRVRLDEPAVVRVFVAAVERMLDELTAVL